MRSLSIALAMIFLLAGAGCVTSKTPVQTETVHFATPIELAIGQTITFEDGLQATLAEINDSRCPADVQCIWAGELSPLIEFSGGILDEAFETRLGLDSVPMQNFGIYTVNLVEVSETTATISVSTSK